MKGWTSDKRWSDKFIPLIKPILGTHLIGEAPVKEDQERNTDLVVLSMAPVRIACRIRKATYWHRYPTQFTIRSSRPSRNRTELDKIISGFGDYLFYGFATADETGLQQWFLGDLSVFREWYLNSLLANLGQNTVSVGEHNTNRDSSSGFHCFDFRALPKEFLFACSWTTCKSTFQMPSLT